MKAHPSRPQHEHPPTSSWRTVPLPPDWHILRPAVLKRDGHQCTWPTDLGRCPNKATDVDHIGGPADHSLENLRALCGPHHKSRTGKQGAQARWTRQRQTSARAKPKHPGLL